MDNPIPKDDTRKMGKRLSKNKNSRDKKILL